MGSDGPPSSGPLPVQSAAVGRRRLSTNVKTTMGVEARGAPMTPEDAVHIAVMPETRAQGGQKTHLDAPHELSVDRARTWSAVAASYRVSLLRRVVWLPTSSSLGVRAFTLLPDEEHTPRVTVGRMVLRREGLEHPGDQRSGRRGDDVAPPSPATGGCRAAFFMKFAARAEADRTSTPRARCSRGISLAVRRRRARRNAGCPDGVHPDAAGARTSARSREHRGDERLRRRALRMVAEVDGASATT